MLIQILGPAKCIPLIVVHSAVFALPQCFFMRLQVLPCQGISGCEIRSGYELRTMRCQPIGEDEALIGFQERVSVNIFAGYQVYALEKERDRLDGERKRLQLAESRLLNPARMHQLAIQLQLVDPDPTHVVYTTGEGALALNAPAK